MNRPSRRALLLGGLGLGAAGVVAVAAGVEEGVLPGRTWMRGELGLDGEPGRIPQVAPGRVVHGSFVSHARGDVRTRWSIAYPPGSRHRPAGAGRAARAQRRRPVGDEPAPRARPLPRGRCQSRPDSRSRSPPSTEARPTGTDDPTARTPGRWSSRSSCRCCDSGACAPTGSACSAGRWAGTPHCDSARSSAPLRCAAVAAESPALWTNGDDASDSGFRDAASTPSSPCSATRRSSPASPSAIDCGTDDPFHDATQAYVAGFPHDQHPSVHYQPGAHDMDYWRRMAPAQLRFVARHLT